MTGHDAGHPCPCDGAELARAWQDVVAGSRTTAVDRETLATRFAAMADDVLAALSDRPGSDPDGPGRAGAALVAMHFTDPSALQHSLALLGDRLSGCPAHPGGAARVADVLGRLASGFAGALRDRTRDEQEGITASAFAARVAAEKARWDSQARFEAVFTEAAVGIAICDIDGTVLESNRSLNVILGRDEDAGPSDRLFWGYTHPGDPPDIWDRIRDLATGRVDHARIEKPLHREDGRTIWTEVVLSLVRNPDGGPRYVVAMIDDVTDYHELRARLTHQAHHDPLTGLANRALFFERLDEALRAGSAVGVCYLDLDGFKAINDTLGHDQGDVLLCTVAERLQAALAPGGHLVARMGGDEFVVLVEHLADRTHLDDVATAALHVARRPVPLGDRDVRISASIGTVRRGDGGTDSAALMKAADTTMYRAKRGGGDRIALFDAEHHRADLGRSALSSRMPEAITRDEFVIEYQPLVRLSDGAVTGVEALVRWQLPTGETLGPGEFVSLAEETGLIVPLGRSVLHTACKQAAAWRSADPRVAPLLSVNLAARQLHELGLLTDVTRILDETGWPARLLQLELTESALMATTEESVSTLRSLADAGVRIAIDDFGTDYSNLAYLRRLPIHTLKLAGQFVNGAPAGPGDRPGTGRGRYDVDLAVVELVVELAHALRMRVVAEWVETEQQCRQLRDLRCDIGQGFHFAPPVAAPAVPDLVLSPPWQDGWPTSAPARPRREVRSS